jgi:dTDP-glucose 4,6-dehydratase
MNNILVTGGAGFIGSEFCHQQINKGNKVVVLDIMSYAANMDNLKDISENENFTFIKGDIKDAELIAKILREHKINRVVNFAAESHVDNSITGPEVFIQTNVLGTYHMLWTSLKYWEELGKPEDFRFLHVSTDEVYGELDFDTEAKFSENTPYAPNSPYSASKAASDHLVRAWHETYGMPTITTNCSNNYGERQHHEKLIPHMIKCALEGKPLPVYGKGENIRDWIYVGDHCRGIALALENGKTGRTYCFGGNSERTNIDVVKLICACLDELRPRKDGKKYEEQITFVGDRLGHDLRYAIDDTRAREELGYTTDIVFEDRMKDTVKWYISKM